MNLKFCNNISKIFSWYNKKNILLSSYFLDGFIGRDFDLNTSFFYGIQENILEKINSEFSFQQVKCYYFIVLETENSRIENYFKIWKKISKKYDTNFLNVIYEDKITIKNKKYFVSLVDFEKEHLGKIIPIQIDYTYRSCCLIDLSFKERLKECDIIFLSNTFVLSNNMQEVETKLFTKYCPKNMMILRIGSGGEDMRFDFIFQEKKNLL